MIKNNVYIKIFLCITLIFFGTSINFIVHELSHLLMLWICGGNIDDISLFGDMFVAGYINYNHIATVALGSIFIPFIISAIFSCIKNYWVIIWNLGFTVPTLINIILGLYANFFIKDVSVQNTYDLALACNFMDESWLIICLCVVILILISSIIWSGFKTLKEEI